MAPAGSPHLLVLSLLFAVTANAQETRFLVQPEPVRAGGELRISVTLQGSDAGIEIPEPPVTNLRIVGGPYSSSEFQWVNGAMHRQRIIEWRAVAGEPGFATVGPLELRRGSRRLRIEAERLSVVPPGTSGAGMPADVQPGVQVRLDLSSTSVAQGEQIYATWVLVATEPIRDVNVVEAPAFEGFWVEHLPITERRDRQIWLDGARGYEITLRRAVIYPLRSGTVAISPMRAEADVLVASRDFRNPLSLFEGRIESVLVASAQAAVNVSEVPQNAQVTGTVTMRCTPPGVSPSGNISWDVTVESDGNLRLATPPQLAGRVEGQLSVEDLWTDVRQSSMPLRMARSWRMQIFPSRAGTLDVPPVVFRAWNPATSRLGEFSCAGTTLVVPQRTVTDDSSPPDSDGVSRSFPLGWTVAIMAAAALVLVAALIVRRRGRRGDLAPEINTLLVDGDAPERRRRLEGWLARRGHDPYALAWQEGELGEAWREVLSLLEREQREPLREGSSAEMRPRIERLVRAAE